MVLVQYSRRPWAVTWAHDTSWAMTWPRAVTRPVSRSWAVAQARDFQNQPKSDQIQGPRPLKSSGIPSKSRPEIIKINPNPPNPSAEALKIE